MREDIADLSVRLADSEASAELLPHRRKYLLIVIGFLRHLLDLHLELVDEVERELAPMDRGRRRPTPRPSNRASRSNVFHKVVYLGAAAIAFELFERTVATEGCLAVPLGLAGLRPGTSGLVRWIS